MKKIIILIISILIFNTSTTYASSNFINPSQSTYRNYLEFKSNIIGTWKGEISGLDFKIKFVDRINIINGRITISDKNEKLIYLGFKNSIPGIYFWRNADKATICIYFIDDDLTMSYFEKDSVRTLTLQKIDN